MLTLKFSKQTEKEKFTHKESNNNLLHHYNKVNEPRDVLAILMYTPVVPEDNYRPN